MYNYETQSSFASLSSLGVGQFLSNMSNNNTTMLRFYEAIETKNRMFPNLFLQTFLQLQKTMGTLKRKLSLVAMLLSLISQCFIHRIRDLQN